METPEEYGGLHKPLKWMMEERAKEVPERFTWKPGTQQRERQPIITKDEMPWSDTYGPHICPVCYGAGWLRDTRTIGNLEKCLSCETVEQQQINRQLAICWQVGKLNPNTPNPPTFDGFETRDPAAAAMHTAAIQFARQPRGFLTIYGTYGAGKSHLAQSVARSLLSRRQPCLYTTASALFEYLGAVHRSDDDDTDYTGRMTWCVYVRTLIIDELNMEGNSKAVADLRRSLIDARYQRAVTGEGGATMLISNTAPDGWHDQAVASRASDTRFVMLESTAVDYRKVQR